MTRHSRLRERRLSEAEAHDAFLKRQIVNILDMWALCCRPACNRARLCRGAGTPCFDEQWCDVQFFVACLVGDWCRLLEIPFDVDPQDYNDL